MTPLKTPIVLRIETAEEALCVWHRLNVPSKVSLEKHAAEHYPQTCQYIGHAENTWRQFFPMAVENGLSISKALPQPVTIGGRTVESQPDGSIRFGGTTITRDTLLKVLALSDAEVKKGAEWPKYYKSCYGGTIRFDSEDHVGIWDTGLQAYFTNHEDCANHKDMTRLSPAEAAEILKGAK